MEIKEKKKNGRNWIKELIIILVGVMLLALFNLRADAAENTWSNTFTVDGKEFHYYYITDFNSYVDGNLQFTWHRDEPMYFINYKSGSANVWAALSWDNTSILRNNKTPIEPAYENGVYYFHSMGSNYTTNFPIEDSENYDQFYLIRAFISYMKSDDFEEYQPEPDLSDIESIGSYSEYIPTPKITVDDVGYGFGFNNAADNYYFELQGRWYSVDDIELFKENLQWKYKYSTLIKSSLTSWVNASDKLHATDGYDFADLGENSFETFLNSYPVDNRTYYGGTNAVGNYFSGYNNALDTIKMLLNNPESLFNGLEIYIRYFTVDDDGNVEYGKWCHWYDTLADSAGSSGSEIDDKQNMHSESQSEFGLTTDQKESLEESGDSKSDTDVITQYINNSPDEIASQKIWDVMQSMISAMGVFPSLVSTVFGWLPSWLINMIAVSLASLIILRFLGR